MSRGGHFTLEQWAARSQGDDARQTMSVWLVATAALAHCARHLDNTGITLTGTGTLEQTLAVGGAADGGEIFGRRRRSLPVASRLSRRRRAPAT